MRRDRLDVVECRYKFSTQSVERSCSSPAPLADGLEHRRLMAADGLQYVVDHVDGIYKDTRGVKRAEGERALFQGQNTSDNNFISYVHHCLVEFARYEAVLCETLPVALKSKLWVRQTKLILSQAQQVTSRLGGSRDLASIQSALCRLDTDRDLPVVTVGGSRAFFEDGADAATYFEDEHEQGVEADDLADITVLIARREQDCSDNIDGKNKLRAPRQHSDGARRQH
eukprot:1976676-Amphidinium_carterae.1